MRKSVYRTEAIQANQKSTLGSVLIIQPLSHYFLTLCLCGCAFLLIFFSYQLQYSRRIQVSGILLPDKGLIKIQSPKAGIVLEKLVKEGKKVNAGDVLFVVSTDIVSSSSIEPDRKIETSKSIQKSIEFLRENLEKDGKESEMGLARQQSYLIALRKNLEQELNQVELEIEIQNNKFDSAKIRFEQHVKLEKQGQISLLALQQKNDDFLDQKARLESTKRSRLVLHRDLNNVLNELDQIKIKFSREKNQLTRQILELKNSSTSTLSGEKVLITAPQSGEVATIAIEPGQVVSNQVLLTIVPENSFLEAQIYLPSSAIAYIKVGDELPLRVRAFPYLKFGKIKGIVKEISQTSLDQVELPIKLSGDNADEPVYRIKVSLATQSILAAGTEKRLWSGMQLETEIVLERHSILGWIFQPIFKMRNAI